MPPQDRLIVHDPKVVQQMLEMAYAGYRSHLGGQSDFLNAVADRIRKPQVGDLVIEISKGTQSGDPDAIGYLDCIDSKDFNWVRITTLMGKEVTWDNCSFSSVLTPAILAECEPLQVSPFPDAPSAPSD